MSHSDDMGNVLPYDIDDLTYYIFKNYSGLLTTAEKGAYLALIMAYKGERCDSDKMKAHMRSRFESTDPESLALLKQGAREFYIATRNRFLRDHGKEIFLNHCPKCGALAHTPKACLCPACSHTWFETRSA